MDVHDFGGKESNANGKSGPDGVDPAGSITFDAHGNMYGNTVGGGPNISSSGGDGTVWKITASGVYKDLHDFGGTVTNSNGTSGRDGVAPPAGVTIDSAGDLYGTTSSGGLNGYGVVWEITASGVYKDLHDFGGTVTHSNGKNSADGAGPEAGVTLDSTGNLYGTTANGGLNGYGMVWEIPTSGAYKDLHDFGGTVTNADGTSGPDGSNPYATVNFDAAGNMFGTTSEGGPNDGLPQPGDFETFYFDFGGVLWEITKAGLYKDLHDFGGSLANGSYDGDTVNAGVTFDKAGNMFGTASNGGAYQYNYSYTTPPGVTFYTYIYGCGIVWEMSNSGVYTDLHDFGGPVTNADGTSGTDGLVPDAGVVFDSSGAMYGTTNWGGVSGTVSGYTVATDGMVWEITPDGIYKDLHDFGAPVINANRLKGPDGIQPVSTVALDAAGNIFGTTPTGGPNSISGSGTGMIWKLLTAGESSLTLTPNSVVAGASTTGTLVLSSAADIGGVVVNLHSSNASAIVPSAVFIPTGSTTASFKVSTGGVNVVTQVSIEATVGTASKSATFSIVPPPLVSFTLNSYAVRGGNGTTGTVALSMKAPSGGTAVVVSSSSSAAIVPESVLVPAGESSATFTVKSAPVETNVSAVITAKLGAGSKIAGLKVESAVFTGFTISPDTFVGGSKTDVTGTLSLDGRPTSSGATIRLKSSNPSVVSVPATAFIHSGHESVNFTLKHSEVKSKEMVTITAIYGPTTRTFRVEVDP